MMKAFIERCRSRGKDGSHTKTVCDMHGSVLADGSFSAGIPITSSW